MIIPVVLAGGTGSRLWPVSRESYPKQFINFQDSNTSFFQRTLQRLDGLDGLQSPVILCSDSCRFLVIEQLEAIGVEDASIILEPESKNTAPAIAVAALSAMQHSPAALLLVLAADHHIKGVSDFHDAILTASKLATTGELVTFGVKPNRAETGYGYIKRGEKLDSGFSVDEFIEKPDASKAKEFLDSGSYLWNSGIFMFSASRYLEELAEHSSDIYRSADSAFQQAKRDNKFGFCRLDEDSYSTSPANSIDYAVMEKTTRAAVVPMDAGWSDMGSWDAFWEQSEKDSNGNVSVGDVHLQNVSNSYIHSSSKLIAAMEIDNSIIVETQDSILISKKGSSQKVKTLVEDLKQQESIDAQDQPLVRRPWGSFETLASGTNFQVKRITVSPGGSLSLQLHQYRAEHWAVVSGEAKITIGEDISYLSAGQSTYVPKQAKHRLENSGTEPVVLIEVQCGSYLGEDDIVRFDDAYGRSNSEKK